MRNLYFVIAFLVVLVVHIAGIYIGDDSIELFTKPLLVVLLIGYFFWSTKSVSSGLKIWMAGALILSLTGDVLLMFVSSNAAFFLAGLAAFLTAHLFYIFFFHAIRIHEKIKGKLFLLLLVFIYYVGLMSILTPWLGSYKLPVRIYSVVICFMLMLSMHMLYIKNKKAGWKMFAGALLFVISDSVLAVNKFYISFIEADIIIMFTYGIAQLLIVQGAIEYILSDNK
ncbi:MAG: lysoplasmalogenase [Bacteroidota bacterium]